MSRLFASLACLLLLSACGTTDPYEGNTPPARRFVNLQEQETAVQQFAVYDPLEAPNKYLYKFNAHLDRYVLLPVVDAYTWITPEFLRTRVSRFFSNVGEFRNFTNAILQGSFGKAGETLGRFAINTTAGLLGTFDVATDWGLPQHREDFGQTLGVWGLSEGPYIVLPLFGPSNLRDTAGIIGDFFMFTAAVPNDVEDSTAYKIGFWGMQPLDMRYTNQFRYFESGSPFEYEFVRFGNTRLRQMQVEQ